MGKGETGQVRSVEEVAQRHELGRRLSATPLVALWREDEALAARVLERLDHK